MLPLNRALLLVVALLLLTATAAPAAEAPVQVLVGERALLVPYLGAHVHDDRIFVPVKAFAEMIGAAWTWEGGKLTFGGKPVAYEGAQAPHEHDGRVYAPVRVLAQLAGGSVQWSQESRTVSVSVPVRTEVWVSDQGTDKIHILDGDGNLLQTIDIAPHGSKPHMIVFNADASLALVANIGGSGSVSVIRTADRSVLQTIAAEAGSHAAVFAPDGKSAIIAHTTANSLWELTWDAAAGKFAVGRKLGLREHPLLSNRAKFPANAAICAAYTGDGKSIFVTLGGGSLVIVDAATFAVVKAYDKETVAPNGCGLALSPDGSRMYVNSGTPTSGVWYTFDSRTFDLLASGSTGGNDAHGALLSPDGSKLLTLNRLSDQMTLLDMATGKLGEKAIPVGDAPDLMALSADGRRLYITMRGPNPATGTHALSGGTPGVLIFDLKKNAMLRHVSFGNADKSDVHGIAVRYVLGR